jgi:hypothetical protein
MEEAEEAQGPAASTIVLDCGAFSFSARQKKQGGQ